MRDAPPLPEHGEPPCTMETGLRVSTDRRENCTKPKKLCIPTGLNTKILVAPHDATGHVASKRLLHESQRRYVFAGLPLVKDKDQAWRHLLAQCQICQATMLPNWARQGHMEANPVPETIMSHVCLDVFAPPATTWEGTPYDALVLCVDCHCGWVTRWQKTKRV